MDLDSLKELKIKAKGLSILVVEDSKALQKQVKQFLDKFFLNIYQAYDGEDGLAQYKEFEPSIVVSDLSMPRKSGISMIRDIKYFDDKAKIIVLSAHNDEETLMDIIKLDIANFLLKPLNIDQFMDTLLTILGSEKPDQYEHCMHDLNIICQQKAHISFVNHFKNYVLEQEGHIVSIDDDVFKIKIPHTQILAIDYEQNTIIELKTINKFMKLKLLKIDKENDLIYLTQPIYVDYILKNITNKHYFYAGSFTIGLHNKHHFMSLKVLDMTYEEVTMYSSSEDIELDIANHVNLTISLEEKDIYSRGKITSIEPYQKGLKIISSLDIKREDRLDFKKYLHKIEAEIIKKLI